MKRNIRIILFTFFIAFSLFSFSGCSSKKNQQNNISVSIEPLKYFVDQLTSGNIPVNVMVPMGASPATYAPTTKQLVKLSSSKIYVGIGYLGFEQAWMNKMKDLNPDMSVLLLAKEIELISDEHHHDGHDHKGVDPHIWMSPKTVKSFLPALRDFLMKSFPEYRENIKANYSTLIEQVSNLDEDFETMAQNLTYRKFIIYHPALSYLARDYGLEQLSIEIDGKEPSPRQLQELIEAANRHNIRLIFIQQEFDQRNAYTVKEATDAELVTINPLDYAWADNLSHLKFLLEKHLK